MATDMDRAIHRDELSQLSPEELYKLYVDKQINFGRAALALDRRRGQNRLYVSAEEAGLEKAGHNQNMIVSPELGFNVHNLHVFTTGRAGAGHRWSERYHTHGDALKYYIRGGGYEVIGDERIEVNEGDFCHVPANVWHGTENPNPDPMVFLAAQQFPGTYRQVATPFVHLEYPEETPEVKDLSNEELRKLSPRHLYLRYREEAMDFGRVASEMDRRRQQKRLHVPAEEAPVMELGPGRHNIISPELGFDIYSFHLYMEHVPGHTEHGQAYTSGDAVRHYLYGEGIELIGDQRINVKAGDFACIPAGTRHETINPNGEPMRFICWQQIPGTYLQLDTPYLPVP